MRVLKSAKIVLHTNLSVIDCVVRDQSDGGLRLVVDNAMTLPNEFRLNLISDHCQRDVAVMWRKGNQMGVAFRSLARPS